MDARKKSVNGIHIIFKVAGGLFFGCQMYNLIFEIAVIKNVVLNNYLLLGFIFLLIISLWGCYSYLRKCDDNKKIMEVLFILAFMPRVLLGCVYQYVPTNDFQAYVWFGANFIHSGKIEALVQSINSYGMPEMGGLTILSAIISWLFKGNITGYILTNCVLTSIITIFIYYFGEKYSREVGIIGGLLFALYPMNIISTQVTTNHHGAIFFTMLGVFFFDKQRMLRGRRKIPYIFGSGISLVLSNFCHASVIIPILALGGYTLVRCLESVERKKILIFITELGGILAVFLIINSLCIFSFGHIPGVEKSSTNFVGKIYVGFNPDTRGGYCKEDSITLTGLDGGATWKLLKERMSEYDIRSFTKLLVDKLGTIWFGKDSYGMWYLDSMHQKYKDLEAVENVGERAHYLSIFSKMDDIEVIDMIYVNIIYIFFVGGIAIGEYQKKGICNYHLWLALGWIGVHLFIEVQARYRYLAMPSIFICASIGMCEIMKRFRAKK